MVETRKAAPRRDNEGFFDKYCQGKGIDIGCGKDPISDGCVCWEKADGDAQLMQGVEDDSFDWVYSSHCLEHIVDTTQALKNWWRILKPNGFLILLLPHRDLYEKRKKLPSRWNPDHKHLFLPDKDDHPDTLGILPLINEVLTNFEVIYCKTCDEGHSITDPTKHSDGEYSIEIVVRKIT